MIAWIIVILTLAAGYGWSSRLLRENSGLALTLGLALSVGALTLIMFWESLLSLPLTFVGIALPYFVLMLPGWWRVRLPRLTLPSTWGQRFVLLILLVISAAILFNGAYWPFYRDDTLGIYAPAAQAIYQTRALVPLIGTDSLYRAYPVLIPLSYSYAYFAAGWQNEYLAKAIATLLSLACLPAAYLLGKQFRSERVGWLAALILILTPFFGRWASSGYVDLPMAFFYTLSALFALRLWQSSKLLDAALAGTLMGLAAWTKNAALVGVILLILWLMWCLIQRKIGLRTAAVSLIACALVAAPWYIRNEIGAGFIMPATAWVDQAQRTLDTAFIFVTHTQDFSLPGLLLMFGVLVALRDLLWKRKLDALVLMLWTLPFFAAWWLLVSYDPRFLLLFLPLLCVLASDPLVRLWDWIGSAWHPRYAIALTLLTLILAAPILFNSVDYKPQILRHPFMGDADKHAIVGH
ncbi:MAG TPA: glycosyltransferase family 39 protein [Phototrophicaceae bacterium]|nr:glycosyltransferase family 39 protein [Phototrophicaceae bacterium]